MLITMSQSKDTLPVSTPLSFDKWSTIREVKAKSIKHSFELSIASIYASSNVVKNAKLQCGKRSIDIMVKTRQIGRHFFPPPIKTIALNKTKVKSRKLDENKISGFHPAHLGLHAIPKQLPNELRIIRGWKRPKG